MQTAWFRANAVLSFRICNSKCVKMVANWVTSVDCLDSRPLIFNRTSRSMSVLSCYRADFICCYTKFQTGQFLGDRYKQRFALCYRTVSLSVCLWRWCIVAKRFDGSRATWCGGRPRPRRHCVRWRPSSPTERGTAAPHFSAHVYCGQTIAHLSNCWALVAIYSY